MWRLSKILPNRKGRITQAIKDTGASSYTLKQWDKAIGVAIKIYCIPSYIANIIKQEALASDIDAAVHMYAVNCGVKTSDVIVTGNIRGIRNLAIKLKKQDFPINTLAADLLNLVKSDDSTDKTVEVMAILNITPDSFSDGGKYYNSSLNESALVKYVEKLVESDIAYVDVGGVSTRPAVQKDNSLIPQISEELNRVIPAIKLLKKVLSGTSIKISVDTFRSVVAKECLDLGVDMINDQFGWSTGEMLALSIAYGTELCTMHCKSDGRDVMSQMHDFAYNSLSYFQACGFNKDKTVIDPGFGFDKTIEENFTILNSLSELREYGARVLVGLSGKSMLGKAVGKDIKDRGAATVAAETIAIINGADIIRTHDPFATIDAIKVIDAVNM